MAFAQQSEIGRRYSLRPYRALPGSFRHRFESEEDDDFVIDCEPISASCDNKPQAQESGDGDWFTIELIKDHRTTTWGSIQYQVKWKDWDDPTWEPGENLRKSNPQIVMQYHRNNGWRKRSTRKEKSPRRRRPRTRRVAGRPQQQIQRDWSVTRNEDMYSLLGSWRKEVRSIHSVDREEGKLIVSVTWFNGNQTQLIIWGSSWGKL